MHPTLVLRGRSNALAVRHGCEKKQSWRRFPSDRVSASVDPAPVAGPSTQQRMLFHHQRRHSPFPPMQELDRFEGKRFYGNDGESWRGAEDMFSPKSWSWSSLVGASVLGCGAVAACQTPNSSTDDAKNEALVEGYPRPQGNGKEEVLRLHTAKPLRKEDEGAETRDTSIDDAVKGKAVVPISVDEVAARNALRKRKTTSGKERFVISSAAVRGDRATMEDTSFVSDCKRFSAVFDGHGGAAVSQYLRKNYFSFLGPELTRLDEDICLDNDTDSSTVRRAQIELLLKTSMEKIDAEIAQKNEWKYQGSTATGVLLYDDVIYSVNVGDCRAVLSRSGDAVELTRDHKPNDPSEQSRIESLGGTVKWYGYVDAQGDPIEPYGAYRINGNLAVARAIGDRDLRPFVNGEPEVKAFKRDANKDEFIVIASDGLWDVFTSEEVVTFVKDVMSGEVGGRESWRSGGHSDTRVPIFEWSQQYKSDRSMIKAARKRRQLQIAKYLVQEALYRGTSDNVSVIVVWLR